MPVVVVSAMAKVTDQLVAMGQKAATGDSDSSLLLLHSLRQRHLQAALELLGAKQCAALIPKLEAVFSDLESFLRGLAAVRELTPRGSDYLLSFGELLSSLIVADAFGAEFKCDAPEHRLPAATRKAMMLLFARAAAMRLQSLADPTGPYWDAE
jgi:aspartokinase